MGNHLSSSVPLNNPTASEETIPTVFPVDPIGNRYSYNSSEIVPLKIWIIEGPITRTNKAKKPIPPTKAKNKEEFTNDLPLSNNLFIPLPKTYGIKKDKPIHSGNRTRVAASWMIPPVPAVIFSIISNKPSTLIVNWQTKSSSCLYPLSKDQL